MSMYTNLNSELFIHSKSHKHTHTYTLRKHTTLFAHTHTHKSAQRCVLAASGFETNVALLSFIPSEVFFIPFFPPWKTEFMTRHLFCWVYRPSAALVNDFPAISVASQNTWWHKWHEKYAIQFVSGYYFVARTVTVMFWLWAFSVELAVSWAVFFFKSREKKVFISPPLEIYQMSNLVWLNFISLQAHLLARCPFVRREKRGEKRSGEKVLHRRR